MTRKECQEILDTCRGKVRIWVNVDWRVERCTPIMFDYYDKMQDYGSLPKDKDDEFWIEITTIDEYGDVEGFESFKTDQTWNDVYKGLLRAYELTKDWKSWYEDGLSEMSEEQLEKARN